MNHDPQDDPYSDTLSAMKTAYLRSRAFIEELPNRPVSRMMSPQDMAEILDEPLPGHSTNPALVIDEWFTRADNGIVADPGPRFFGFVDGGVTPAALAGDWLATTIDQNTGMWILSPAAAQTELVVHRWLKELFGLPPAWSGILTSGGSMSNFIGLAAARQWASGKLGFDATNDGLSGNPPIHIVSSSAIHASAIKALGNLGLGRSSVTQIPTGDGTMDIDRLRAHLQEMEGPVILIANAGEVNTGQFDDLNAMVEVRDHHPGGAWLHVDGAFGLFAGASPTYRHLIAGIEHADSVASDGHKWLNVPYDCGFAFIRDEGILQAAFSSRSAYLTRSEGFDADNYNPEFSRRFRALAAWCSLKSLGRSGYQTMIERCIDNAQALASWVESREGLELVNRKRQREHPFNIVCFRYTDASLTEDELNVLNQRAVEAIQRDGRTFVSGTSWNGQAAIRAAFVNWTTTRDDVRILQTVLEDLKPSLYPGS